MTPLAIPAFTVTTALGRGLGAQLGALHRGRSGLRAAPFEGCGLPGWTGVVDGLDQPLSAPWQDWDCRNNRLAELGLQQDGFFEAAVRLRERHGAARVGLFIGSSTAGVHQTEGAYRERGSSSGPLPAWFRYRNTQNMYSVADYLRLRLGLDGVSMVISTACSSSAKVFASAQRAIAAGFCDAAIVGGVDSLCQTTLYGFNSLQLLSSAPCRPADIARNGISIGEAAGFAIVEPGADAAFALLGYGESSDAWHMSAPEPDGRGAFEAMSAALQRASLIAAAVDYINLHGTATPANDLAESRAVCRVFGSATACSSTKGWTGHTLGAAGIVEAVLSLLCLENGLIPRSLNSVEIDPAIEADIILETRRAPIRHVLSNSFGFGGSNCSLLFGRQP
ncbi:beta-ketoacyl-[acyl-carrier-protein] synthase family protein [Nevskia sp.]|uniref:beta-ketoacyl-[acyl-carrier-protein] synthase family protein n=1 Tax=Nevskia sp. TaxID=1929292 RepID=UPI0025D70D0E|nr:beta-ketoacyl-[acyl-carrier-protein] synthase family protein [Nevskia sp.]